MTDLFKGHHPFGPSSFARRVLCPGSWKQEQLAEEQGCIPEEHEEEKERGTRLHKAVEDLITTGESEITDEEEIRLAQKAAEYVRRRVSEAKIVYTERLLTLFGHDDQFLLHGTADVVAVYTDHVVVIDLKFGRYPVFTEFLEWQLKCYAAAAMQEFKKKAAGAYGYQVMTDTEYSGAYEL